MSSRAAGQPADLPVYRPMTRCECADRSFEDLARLMRVSGWTPAQLVERTGCGQLCTACRPDLEEFLRLGGLTVLR